MTHFERLERLRMARDFARTARRVVHRAMGEAIGTADELELIVAAGGLDDVIDRLERVLRLTDPASAGPLARRADEDRIPAGT